MRNLLRLIFSLGIIICTNNLFAQSQEEIEQYIDKYKRLAMEEQLRSGVPAAITLAQGIHEATAGKSELATEANNHFGIKCKSTWTGLTYLHDDDAKQECFRKYASAEQSYIDHSDFLKNNNRYHFLFDLDVTDYQGWAAGLKRAGYATNPSYVRRLTDLIEKYNLQEYTNQAQNKKFETVGEVVPEKDKNVAIEPKEIKTQKTIDAPEPITNYYKGLKGFWAKKGDMLLEKAVEYNIRYARLLQINNIEDAPLPFDMYVFTEKKRKVGTVEFHTVTKDETMQMISQKEAMLLDNLYSFNNMTSGQEPEVGEQLSLQYKAYGTPKMKATFLEPLTQKEEPTVVSKHKVKKIVEEEIDKPIEATKDVKELADVKKETPTEEPKEIIKEEVKKVDEEPVLVMPKKKELPKRVEEKIEEVKVEPLKEETKTEIVIDETSPIKDIEKAKKIETLLSKEKKVEADAITKVVEIKQDIPKPVEETKVAIIKEEVKEMPIVKKAEVIIPKRTYNEKNVDEDTKALKRKFDEAVYKPLPERKIIEKTIVVKDSAKIKTAKKEIASSKIITPKTVKKETVKKPELKKAEPKKEIISAKQKAEKTKIKKTEKTKEDSKKIKEKDKKDKKKDKTKKEDKKKSKEDKNKKKK